MKLSRIWMATSLILIVVLSVLTDSSLLQIIAAVCGVIYIFSTVFENKWGQLFGMVNSALYGYIMFSNGVYGTAVYDIIYCVPMQIYTFFTWGKNKEGKNRTEISRLTTLQRVLLVIGTATIIAIYCIVAPKLSVKFALVDGISIILGIAGLYMTSRKKIEQWYTFIISNIAMLGLWGIKCSEDITNMPMLVMWCIYLINNCYGLYSWNKELKKQNTEKTSENLKENAAV